MAKPEPLGRHDIAERHARAALVREQRVELALARENRLAIVVAARVNA